MPPAGPCGCWSTQYPVLHLLCALSQLISSLFNRLSIQSTPPVRDPSIAHPPSSYIPVNEPYSQTVRLAVHGPLDKFHISLAFHIGPRTVLILSSDLDWLRGNGGGSESGIGGNDHFVVSNPPGGRLQSITLATFAIGTHTARFLHFHSSFITFPKARQGSRDLLPPLPLAVRSVACKAERRVV